MFGVKQISSFIEKSGKTSFTLREFSQVLGVKETSAKRYLHEAARLGLITLKDGIYHIDDARLTIINEAIYGLKDQDSLIKFLKALEKKGTIKNVSIKREEKGDINVDFFKITLKSELDEKSLQKLNQALSDPSSKILCTIVPSYLTTELILLIKNRLNLPATSFIEISSKTTVVVFEREE